ncbi:hypothetical protein CHS0354_040811 [Potamilus streckersoni]|uniref:Receptor ligand binding region domain-containing protein n=1 Tax=Potamilus streckersoni TaxID=2493646 RepID=A0AAE0SLC3_9BIVA|nr:hypothetical protein CHS0354_040811 [Potamilus streckersoni]
MRACRLIIFLCMFLINTLAVLNENQNVCPKTATSVRYSFVIGVLSPRRGETLLSTHIENELRNNRDEVRNCFHSPNYVSLSIEDLLDIPKQGWTRIQDGIINALTTQAQQKDFTAVVGPFYMNLAMILERVGTPYIVTDHKGFNWSDVSRVNDHVSWSTVVEVRPPMKELNRAVVDVFLLNKWKSTIVIMPENPKDNQECQDLANQMTQNGISPITYSLRFDNSVNIRIQTSDVLRYVQLLEQKVILVCSPRDHDYNLIETVLLEVV